MTGIVKFKFKHQNTFDKIEFSGSEITVAELRIKIQEKLMLADHGHHHRNATVLEISNLGTEEPYEWDHELIPTHTSVLIARIPASKAKTQKIIVEKTDMFSATSGAHEDAFAPKPSIIQSELETIRRVPTVVVCELCSWVMLREVQRHPVILTCCGNTVCFTCAKAAGTSCPIEKREPFSFVSDRAVERIVNVVLGHKEAFAFDSVNVPSDFLTVREEEPQKAEEVEVVDVDEFEPEVFDVDNPRPLTAKELEIMERRERRKRKALEILAKREGVVKGELTEADVNRLLKTEIKSELTGMETGGADQESEEETRIGKIVIEFPKLLTKDQFELWKSQHRHL
jgi:hypothetical protein